MRSVERNRADRVTAGTVVIVVHAALAWMLAKSPVAPPSRAVADAAIDVVWIPARAPVRRAAMHAGVNARPRVAALPPRPERARHANTVSATVADPAVPSRPLTAVYIAQAELPVEPPGTHDADAFADRRARLPGREARAFRMAPSLSPAERLAAFGRMFGGGDDPCRSARDSINDLSQVGDSGELQQALDYEKRHCR